MNLMSHLDNNSFIATELKAKEYLERILLFFGF